MTLLGLSTVAPTGAASNVTHVAYLTFSRPVQLPGVVLNAGTYVFEQPNPLGAWDFVRVSSRDRKIVYLTAYTRRVERPRGVPADQMVSFGESRANTPRPIVAWWPIDQSLGHQFVYSTGQ
jgi:hypothetical protein